MTFDLETVDELRGNATASSYYIRKQTLTLTYTPLQSLFS